MGFYKPRDTDAIGNAQFEALEAMEAQLELALRRAVEREGLTYTNRFAEPVGMTEQLQGYWNAMMSAQHSLGGVHIGVFSGIRRRQSGAVPGATSTPEAARDAEFDVRSATATADPVDDAASTVGDYQTLDRAIGAVLFNVSNFPERAQTRLMGANMRPLTEKLIDAVQAAGFRRTSPEGGAR